MKFLSSEKGTFKLYLISNAEPYFSGMVVTEIAPPGEYVVATSIEEAIETWKAKPGVHGQRTPTSVKLVSSNLTIADPDSA